MSMIQKEREREKKTKNNNNKNPDAVGERGPKTPRFRAPEGTPPEL